MAKTNSPKYRDFFITINKGAESYDDALEIIQDLNFTLYALIIHDKDSEVLDDGTLRPKETHKHIMVEVKNPVSFEAMKARFKGAHIEIPKYKKSAYQYLIHNRPNAKEKYQYAFDEIVTNAPQELKFIIESETFEIFKENMFLEYIADGTRTPYQFTKRFGLNAYKQYWKPYQDMLLQLQDDEEMQSDLQALLKERAENDLPF